MAVVAEGHVVDLILNQQTGLGRSVGLVAGEATERCEHFGLVGWVHDVGDGVVVDGVSKSKAKRQDHDFVFGEVVFGQFYFSVEDGEEAGFTILLRRGIGTVTFEAKSIALGAEQVIDFAAMRGVAS